MHSPVSCVRRGYRKLNLWLLQERLTFDLSCMNSCVCLPQYTISCSPGGSEDRVLSTASLQNMFKCVNPGMSPFRILYNLEVLSRKWLHWSGFFFLSNFCDGKDVQVRTLYLFYRC